MSDAKWISFEEHYLLEHGGFNGIVSYTEPGCWICVITHDGKTAHVSEHFSYQEALVEGSIALQRAIWLRSGDLHVAKPEKPKPSTDIAVNTKPAPGGN